MIGMWEKIRIVGARIDRRQIFFLPVKLDIVKPAFIKVFNRKHRIKPNKMPARLIKAIV